MTTRRVLCHDLEPKGAARMRRGVIEYEFGEVWSEHHNHKVVQTPPPEPVVVCHPDPSRAAPCEKHAPRFATPRWNARRARPRLVCQRASHQCLNVLVAPRGCPSSTCSNVIRIVVVASRCIMLARVRSRHDEKTRRTRSLHETEELVCRGWTQEAIKTFVLVAELPLQ